MKRSIFLQFALFAGLAVPALVACSSREDTPTGSTSGGGSGQTASSTTNTGTGTGGSASTAQGGAGGSGNTGGAGATGGAGGAGGSDFGFEVGVNISGLEYGKNPGKVYFDYVPPSDSELDYFKSKNMKLIRLPFQWTRLQPTPSGALEPTYLGVIRNVVDRAATRGMRVLLDVHGYGGRSGGKIGGGVITLEDFADLWKRLATEFVGVPGVGGYDIMNEPSKMPSPAVWPAAAQAAVDAIRTVDTKTAIYVEGDGYSSAGSWVSSNPNLHIQDPAQNIIYSAHCYLDRDNSGTHFVWADEVAHGVTTQTGVKRLTVFVEWLKAHGYRGHIGEMGAGNDDQGWLDSLGNSLAYLKANNVQFTYWAAGQWWGDNYGYSVEPKNSTDTVQMSVLSTYATP